MTSVPSRFPAAGWTTSPAGLSTTSRCSSSKTIGSGISCGSLWAGSGSGIARVKCSSPFTLVAGSRTALPSRVSAPDLVSTFNRSRFDDVRVPVTNRLGDEGTGFLQLVSNLPQERLSIAVTGVAAARVAFERTLAYAKERQAFGQPIASFQHNRFVLAEMATEIEIGQSFIDRCVLALNAGELTADEAAMAKWWCTELQGKVIDRGVQLHGGYGYMAEYPIARAYTDARITRIYGGTTEIMKEIIGRSLGV